MRIWALICLAVSLVPSTAQAQPAQAAAGRSGSAPRIVSPEIAPDRRVTFRLLAPKAGDVTLTGEFLPASADPAAPPAVVHMTKGADGVWSTTVGPIEPEVYVVMPRVPRLRRIGGASTARAMCGLRCVIHGRMARHLRFDAVEFLERLAVLIPRPRGNSGFTYAGDADESLNRITGTIGSQQTFVLNR